METFPLLRAANSAARLAILVIVLSATLSAAVNEWTRVGPPGGRVVSLAAEPRNPSTVYAATCDGVFKTANGGVTWVAANSGLQPGQNLICSSEILAVDPQNAGTVYAAADRTIFETTDGGAHWSAISTLNAAQTLRALLIDFSRPTTLFASDQRSIFKSVDAGVTWTRAVSEPVNDNGVGCCTDVLAVDPRNADTVYGTNIRGLVFKSADAGASWNSVNSGLTGPARVLAIDPQDSNTLYAGGGNQIFKSTDGGASWHAASPSLPPEPPPSPTSSVVSRTLHSLVVHPETPALVYALMDRFIDVGGKTWYEFFLAISTDGAATWTTASDPTLAANDLNTITPDPQFADTLYAGTTNGVLKTTDRGGHWIYENSGLVGKAITQVVVDPQTAGTLIAAAPPPPLSHGIGLFKSTDGGSTWFPSEFGLPDWNTAGLLANPGSPRTLYIVGPSNSNNRGTLFESGDGGAAWAAIWSIPSPGAFVGPLAISAAAPNIIYAGVSNCPQSCDARVARSVDAGRTWIVPRDALETDVYLSALAVNPRDPNLLYAGTSDLGGWGLGNLWKSVDGGVSWRTVPHKNAIFSLYIDPRNPDTIFSSNGGWARSTDGGETWTALRVPCNAYAGVLAIHPKNSSLYCGDDAKVFRSENAGMSWIEVGSGQAGRLTSQLSSGLSGRVNSLTFDPQDPATLYAGTSSGLFVITLRPAAVGSRPHR